jgi:GDPmannose 4,6-dehydratase
MSKKVLITGVTGQDGSYMAEFLLESTNYEIYGMVRRASTNNYHNIKHLLNNNRFKLMTGDLTDSQSIDNIVKEVLPDYFINLAAQSFVGASWQIPEQTLEIDAMGVIRCLEAIRKHAPKCRFYNAGSSEELGNVDYSPQDEIHPLKPRSPYGADKAAARHIVKVYR